MDHQRNFCPFCVHRNSSHSGGDSTTKVDRKAGYVNLTLNRLGQYVSSLGP